MTIFEGQVRNYTLIINTPRSPNKSQSVIALDLEAAGLAFLNFVPQGGTLGTNSKRVGTPQPVFFTFVDTIAAAILKTGGNHLASWSLRSRRSVLPVTV